jgi:mono/diheme cytochrome c family protein
MRISKLYIGVIKKMSAGFLPAFLVCMLFSCIKKDETSQVPGCTATPPSTISYKKDVFPIIKQNCLTCHDATNHYGGIVIETYEQIALSGTSGELYNSIMISSNGKAYMPKGGRLMDCEIALIKAWVDQGAKNN